MNPVLAVLVGVAILASVGGVGVAILAWSQVNQLRTSAARLEQAAQGYEALKLKVDALPSLWEAERQRVEEEAERAKKRWAAARASESRTRRLAEEGGGDDEPGDDDEGEDELDRAFDAHKRGAEALQPVSSGVAGSAGDDLTARALAQGWQPYL